MISSIMVYDFFNTDTISSILAKHIFKDFDRFEVEIEDSKNMGGLRNIPRYRIKNKTVVQNFYTSVPFNSTPYTLLVHVPHA